MRAAPAIVNSRRAGLALRLRMAGSRWLHGAAGGGTTHANIHVNCIGTYGSCGHSDLQECRPTYSYDGVALMLVPFEVSGATHTLDCLSFVKKKI